MDGKEIGVDKIKEEYPELGIILREIERDF
jgi:hypothetical protein